MLTAQTSTDPRGAVLAALAILAAAAVTAAWARRRRRVGFWCGLGLHRWSEPGGECEECGAPDDFPCGRSPVYMPNAITAPSADLIRYWLRETQGHPDQCGCAACCWDPRDLGDLLPPPFADHPGDSPSF